MKQMDSKRCLQFVCARPAYVLNKLTEAGVILMEIFYRDALTVEITVYKRQYKNAAYIIERNFGTVKSVEESGIQMYLIRFLKRPILVIGMSVFLLLTVWLSGRILVVNVSGNNTVPEKRILEEAEKAGIVFGAPAKKIRSEEIKNQMLTALPDLQWVGINTSGCVATICVQERRRNDGTTEQPQSISNIVAIQDGIITDMTIEKGTPLVSLGQAVRKGDMLVSGYEDLGLKVLLHRSQGEIMAHTIRENICISPKPSVHRGEHIGKHTCYKLRIGKKVINFCNHSGIQDAVCVKMYLEDYWTLPGGYRLPIAFIRTQCRYYDRKVNEQNWNLVEQWLPVYAQNYLQSQMIAGKILRKQLSWEFTEDDCRLFGVYACHEMIGQVKYEEITEHNAEDN